MTRLPRTAPSPSGPAHPHGTEHTLFTDLVASIPALLIAALMTREVRRAWRYTVEQAT